jgi:hypothetical protein
MPCNEKLSEPIRPGILPERLHEAQSKYLLSSCLLPLFISLQLYPSLLTVFLPSSLTHSAGKQDRPRGQIDQPTLPCVFLGAKSTSILDCVGWLVRRSVPHDVIMWKTSYVAIASRRGGGGGNWLRRDSITLRFHYVAIPSHLGIRRSPCCSLFFFLSRTYLFSVVSTIYLQHCKLWGTVA